MGIALTARTSRYDMADAIEEKELGDDECLDQHDRTCGDNGEETDDIQDTDCIEDYVTWTGQ